MIANIQRKLLKTEISSKKLDPLEARNTQKKMRIVMRKPAFCICENKAADQMCGNRTANQRLCIRYIDTTIPLLFKSEISNL